MYPSAWTLWGAWGLERARALPIAQQLFILLLGSGCKLQRSGLDPSFLTCSCNHPPLCLPRIICCRDSFWKPDNVRNNLRYCSEERFDALEKERQSVLEFLSHSVISQVILMTSCLEPSWVLGTSSFFSCAFERVLPIPWIPSLTYSELVVCSVKFLAPWQWWPRAGKQLQPLQGSSLPFLMIFLNDVHFLSPLQLFAIHILILDHSLLASCFSVLH